MAPALDLRPVLVGGAGVQDRVVVQELDVARHEVHIEPQLRIARQFAEHVERLDILGRQPPRLGEPLRRPDMQPGIQHRDCAGVLVEHRCLVEWRLALRHLAAPVDRERLVQSLEQIGPARRHDIVHGHRTDDRRQPACLRAPQAQQRDHVAAIDMEVLAFRRRIAADIGIGRAAAAKIVDMPEQMPLCVLRACAAEIAADAPIGCRALGDRPIFDRHAAQQDKAAPIEHLGSQPIKHRPKCRQREVLAADFGKIEAACLHQLQRGFDLGDFRWRQAVAPLRLTSAHIRAGPGGGAFDQSAQRRHHSGGGIGHRASPPDSLAWSISPA